MKRFFAITAMTSMLATGALAASEAQTQAIQQFAPQIDVTQLTDAQVDEMFAVAKGGESDNYKADRIAAIAEPGNAIMVSPEQEAEIAMYVPSWAVESMTGAEKAEAINILSGSGSEVDKKTDIMAILYNENPALTPAEMQRVESFAPGTDLSMLTDKQVDDVRAAIYSNENDGNIRDRLSEILS